MIKALLLLLALPASAMTLDDCGRFIETWEGRSLTPYRDPDGKGWVVGVGHYSSKKPSALSHEQVKNLLRKDTAQALASAKRLVKTFDRQPDAVKQILVDMTFNLGEEGFGRFTNTIKACNSFDYKTMAVEMRDSKWYHQTGRRAKNHVDTIKKIK